MQAARGTSVGDHQHQPAKRSLSWRHLGIFAVVAVSAYSVDVISKWLAVRYLDPGRPVSVVGDVLTLDLMRNPGAAFSTGVRYTMLFSFIAIVAAVVVIVLSRRLGSTLWAAGLGFLLGGILGNLTDRIFRSPAVLEGHVVDFLRLPHWPVFNFADVFINVAAAVVILQAMRGVSMSGHRTSDRDAS